MQLHSEFGLFALSCISPKRFERIFLKSLHIIFIMYTKKSETFIKIDSLQHLEISRLTYPTNRSKMCDTTFTVLTLCWFLQNNARYIYIPPWLVHFSLNSSHLLNEKHWQYSHWNVLVMDIRGSQWGGGFYGYRLKFWLFYGHRLIFFSYG